MKRITYHWAVCAGCALMLACTMGLTATNFPTLLPFIIENAELTHTQGALLTTIRSIFSFSAVFCYELYYNMFKIRVGITLLTVNVAISSCIYAMSNGFAGCCVAAAVGGISHGLGGMLIISIIINRWFRNHVGVATAIATCGTAVAATFFPPIITLVIEAAGLRAAFFTIAGFCLAAAAIIFTIMRNTPADKGLTRYFDEHEKSPEKKIHIGEQADRSVVIRMMFAAFIIGAVANGCISYLSTLLHETELDSVIISFALSLYGVMLFVGKLLYGESIDHLGSVKTAAIFISLFIVGTALFSCATSGNGFIIIAAIICIGFGMALASVALTVYSRDISSAKTYDKTAKHIQIMYMAGSLTLSAVPGMIADATGSYKNAYLMFSILAIVLMVLVQTSYYSMANKKTTEESKDVE